MSKKNKMLTWCDTITECIKTLNDLNTKLVKVSDNLTYINEEAADMDNTTYIRSHLKTISDTSIVEAFNANTRSIKNLEALRKRIASTSNN